MKKIAFIIDRLSEGAGRVVYDLVNGLDKDKFEAVVLSIYKEGNLIEEFDKLGVKIIYLCKGKGTGLDYILKIKKILKKEKAGIVHTHNIDAYEYGALAAKLAGIKNIIHTAHGKSVKKGKLRKLRESIFHEIVSIFIDKYISVSDDLGKYAAKNWCLDKKKIKTIHNGIDTEKYRKIKVDKDFRKKLGIDRKNKVIGIMAGLRPVKDHLTLIKAIEKVKEEIPDCKLLIVGDGPERERIERFTEALGLEDDVLLLGNRKDTVNLYNCFDVGVLSSLSECLSITLLEGMACEKVFIATAVGGNPEVIDNGTDGFLIPPRNPEILADMIIQILKSKKLREDIGRKARKKVAEKFNSQKMITQYEELYLK